MAIITLPDREMIRECLDYNPKTGLFFWRRRPLAHFKSPRETKRWNTRYAGKPAGAPDKSGHIHIQVAGLGLLAHRIAWLLEHGEPVPDLIDHKDGRGWHNAIDNLRPSDYSGNISNSKTQKDTITGIKGVCIQKNGRFHAYITKNRRRHALGAFDTLEEAATARREAAERLHGTFARHI